MPRLPLAAHEVLCVHSEDAYAAWCREHGVQQTLRPADRHGRPGAPPFEVRISRLDVEGGALEVARGGAAAVQVEGPAHEDRYQVLLPVTGHAQLELGGRSLRLAPGGSGAVIGPEQPHSLALSPAWADLSVYVDRTVLSAALRAWTGQDRATHPTFLPTFSMTATQTSRLRLMTGVLYREAEDGASDERLSLLFEQWCLALLRSASGNHQGSMLAHEALATRRHVRTAEEFMNSQVARPVRMTEVAREAGIGLRALQKAFLTYRAQSPLQALKKMRLERARARLSLGAGLSVREAAHGSGLSHLGRFSVEYRHMFGESPSETLRRARRNPIYTPTA